MMPIPVIKEEHDNETINMTPPRPNRALPKVNDKPLGEKKPIFEMSEKSEFNEMDERERVRQQRQDDIDRAMTIIRARRDKITDAARPYALKTRNFAESQPMIFTFLAIFAVLSVVPIGAFLGFIVSAAAFILGTAIVGICLSMLTCILIGASILLPILVFTTSVSAFIVTGLVSLFLLQRFYLHLYATLMKPTGELKFTTEAFSQGVTNWLTEIESRAWLPPLPERISPRAQMKDLPSPTLDEKSTKVSWQDVKPKVWATTADSSPSDDNAPPPPRGRSPLNHNTPPKMNRSLNGSSTSLKQERS